MACTGFSVGSTRVDQGNGTTKFGLLVIVERGYEPTAADHAAVAGAKQVKDQLLARVTKIGE